MINQFMSEQFVKETINNFSSLITHKKVIGACRFDEIYKEIKPAVKLLYYQILFA